MGTYFNLHVLADLKKEKQHGPWILHKNKYPKVRMGTKVKVSSYLNLQEKAYLLLFYSS